MITSFLRAVTRTVAVAAVCLAPLSSGSGQPIDTEKLEGLKPRSVGPAVMSGRVTAIAVVRSDPRTIYLGSASGGLWKSTNGGTDFTPIFDTLAVASIGAIAVDPTNPDIIWVGTGEGNPRNSQTFGNGIYRSLDAGRTWKHLGLETSRSIHRVIIDPTNTDVVYAGVPGASWGAHPERGVFKTTDGGATWKKILYVNDETGAADLVMDPANPRKLFAAMWHYRRWAWFMKSGGPGSGLYVTHDGGVTWAKRTDKDGLPKGELGRIGVAVAPNNPNRVYALVEAKKNALYRSDDGGFTWEKMADRGIGGRPFYYHEIYVDPSNENLVYSIHTNVSVSEDGGRTFRNLPMRIHVDHHAWYIHPDDPRFIIDGNDGGAAISYDRGRTWRFVENLPLGQFYHINVDTDTPYRIYGGLQDNGSWRGPAYKHQRGGIENPDWEDLGGGDGFDVLPDRSTSRFCYGMSQGGNLYRRDTQTGLSKFIRPVHPQGVKLRFNWNAGLAHDPFDSTTIYYGSQFVHRSTNRGDSWQTISPDLTTNDTTKQRQLESGGLTYDVTTAENHCTIITIAPSPLERGVIWAGTDDGNVQLTTDGGATWTNVTGNISGVPDSTWVAQIQASSYNAREAFVVFDNHRRNDWTPYVCRTTNGGRSWTSLATGAQVRGYALSVAQDPVEPRLMFLGTEFGLYVSIDGGQRWTKWGKGFPTVSTMDLVIHPVEHDLVIGTFGRSLYVLDDITPLRELARTGVSLLAKPVRLFTPPTALLSSYNYGGYGSGNTTFRGENRPYGARFTYLITPPDTARTGEKSAAGRDSARASADSVKFEVFTLDGELLTTFREKAKHGFNRATWQLDRKGERMPSTAQPEEEDEEFGSYPVLPGTYRVRLTYGPNVDSTTVNVRFDTRLPYAETGLTRAITQLDAVLKQIRTATRGADRLREAKRTIDQIASVIKDRKDSSAQSVKTLGQALQDTIKRISELITDREVQGIRSDPDLLQPRLSRARMYALATAWGSSDEPSQLVSAQTREYLARVIDAVNRFFGTEWRRYREAVDAAKVSFFTPYEPISVE